MKFWTEERILDLKRRWNSNESGTEIALKYGCSRDAVLGQIGRLKRRGWKTTHYYSIERFQERVGQAQRESWADPEKRAARLAKGQLTRSLR